MIHYLLIILNIVYLKDIELKADLYSVVTDDFEKYLFKIYGIKIYIV